MFSKVAKLVPHVKENAKDGGVDNVMRAIDSFPYRDSLEILNDEKGTLLDNTVTKFNPRVALELGFSCGCSAIRIASKMTKYDSMLLTLQPREEKTKIARELIKHAGLSVKVEEETSRLPYKDGAKLEEFLRNRGALEEFEKHARK